MEVVIDSVTYSDNVLTILGWGFETRINNNSAKKYLLLEAQGKENLVVPCENIYRQDVANAYPNMNEIEICGFRLRIPSDYLTPTFWDYQISLILITGKKIYWKKYASTLNVLAKQVRAIDATQYWLETRKIQSDNINILSDISVKENGKEIDICGWAFCKNNDRDYVKRLAFILPNGQIIFKPVIKEQRIDVAAFYYKYPHISHCGFRCSVDQMWLERMAIGTRCGILMINKYNNESIFKEISGII